VDTAPGEDILGCHHEFLDELVQFRGRNPRLPQPQVQRVFEQRLVIGSEVDVHRQQVLRRHRGTGGVELQFADGDTHAVGAQIAQAQDAGRRTWRK